MTTPSAPSAQPPLLFLEGNVCDSHPVAAPIKLSPESGADGVVISSGSLRFASLSQEVAKEIGNANNPHWRLESRDLRVEICGNDHPVCAFGAATPPVPG